MLLIPLEISMGCFAWQAGALVIFVVDASGLLPSIKFPAVTASV